MKIEDGEVTGSEAVPAPAVEAAALGVEAIVHVVQLPVPDQQPPVVNPAYYRKSHQPLGPADSPFWI